MTVEQLAGGAEAPADLAWAAGSAAIELPSTVITPTYDQRHYLKRADRYAHAAQHEPDAAIRDLLLRCANECRRRALELR